MTREEIRAAGFLDRIFFGHFFFQRDFRVENAPSHYTVNSILNDKTKVMVAVMCHRYWAKSTFLCTVDPTHDVCYNGPPGGNNQNLFNVIIAETQSQSMNHLGRVIDSLEGSSRIRAVFGDFVTGASKWGAKEIRTNNGVRIAALGTGQRVRSLIERGGIRPTKTVLDDFESETNANTPKAREENFKWLYAAVLPYRHRDGRIILTQSPIANDCSIYRVMNDPEWETLRVPLYEIDDDTGEIKLNWEEEWPWERIQAERRRYENQGMGGIFDQEYLLIPYKGEAAGINREDIRWFEGELKFSEMGIKYIKDFREVREDYTPLTEPRDLVINTFSAIDPAIGVEAQHDRTAMVSLGMDFHENMIVLNESAERNSSSFYIGNTFTDFAWDVKANGIGVEVVQFQKAIGEIAQARCDELGIEFDFVRGFNPRSSKDPRLNWAANKFKARRVFMRPSQRRMVKELLEWPSGKHDDYWDALYMAMKISYPPSYEDPNVAEREGKDYLKHLRKIPSGKVA